jgi:hypothetical protein
MLNEILQRTELPDHFLVMTVALVRISGFDLLAHQHIDLEMWSIFILRAELTSMSSHKVEIPNIFILAPVVIFRSSFYPISQLLCTVVVIWFKTIL